MNRLIVVVLLLAGIAICIPAVHAAEQDPPEAEVPAHEELRALRDRLVDAVEKRDVDSMLDSMHEDVVVTWLNGEQSRGRNAVRDYYNRMMEGDEKIVDSFSLDNVEVTELTILYGDDAGVAYGTAKSRFVLTDGRNFSIETPWTATVVKQDEDWVIAAFHSSADVFGNAILDVVKNWIWKAAAIAGVVGLLLGLLIMAVIKRGKREPVTTAHS